MLTSQTCSLKTWLPKSPSTLGSTIMLLNWSMPTVIRPSQLPTGASILLDRESDGSLRLCVKYRSLNNLTIAMLALMARTVTIAITSLTLLVKLGKVWFLQKTFCWLTLACFFTFSNANIWFARRGLVWMTYTAADNQAGGTFQYKKMCDGGQREDDKSLCDSVSKVKNVPVSISAKYSDYINLFPSESTTALPEHTSLAFQVVRWRSKTIHL